MPQKFDYSLGLHELKSKEHRLWQALVAEFLGNFLLNFFACGACTQPEGGTFKALAFGLAVFIAITVIGNISGGHVNPAVTIGLLVAGRVSVLRAVCYIIFQCLGSIAGTAAIRTLIDEEYYGGLGHTHLAPNITELQGLGIEFFLGLVLVLTVFGALDANKPDSRFTAPLAIGLSVTLGHLGTIRYTGASMNPARTLGTAFAVHNWDAHWVYWIGPIMGGIAAALIYTQIIEKPLVHTAVKVIEVSEKYRTHADDREMRKLDSTRDYA
ncbi:aquaporin AQPAe.a isoform X2 [Eurosta solidaginis]|uniref:aquaporin AQPAe.a isoform X2 n=1 Tax=Eurosta solidaginis TaxID=178769 RepID=UPI0035314C21